MKKIIADIGFANLTAELLDNNSIVPEICVCLEDKLTGLVIQDVALVSPAINHTTGELIKDKDAVRCVVWGDSTDESYTDEFVIEKYKEEE